MGETKLYTAFLSIHRTKPFCKYLLLNSILNYLLSFREWQTVFFLPQWDPWPFLTWSRFQLLRPQLKITISLLPSYLRQRTSKVLIFYPNMGHLSGRPLRMIKIETSFHFTVQNCFYQRVPTKHGHQNTIIKHDILYQNLDIYIYILIIK